MSNLNVPYLRLKGIYKSFGSVSALRDVSLSVAPGEVVALLGDNGAGKSTLIKVISGFIKPDVGTIWISGDEVRLSNPHVAAAHGIATVYQDLALCENLDVVANLFLGREQADGPMAGPLRRLAEPEMERRAREALSSLGVVLPSLRRPVSVFSGGQRQAVAVSRALLWGSRLVMLDEPTAALGVEQTAHVLQLIRRLAGQGQAVLVVSHSLPDVFAVADRMVVLRQGEHVATLERRATSPEEVVSAITGGRSIQLSA